MKLTYEKVEAINKNADEMKKEDPYKDTFYIGLGVELVTIGNETKACICEREICDIEEIAQVIKELKFIQVALLDECGIELD